MNKHFHVYLLLLYFVSLAAAAAVRPAVLVDVDWLHKNLNNKDLVVVDMSDRFQYQRFHIPGAVHLPYHAINRRLKNGVSLRVDDRRLTAVLGGLGIERKTHVVLYDDLGGLNAGRLFWELERLGHPKVSVLNGGLVSWILQGHKVDNRLSVRKKTVYRLPDGFKPKNNLIDLAGVKGLNTKKTFLLDVRTRLEYMGTKKDPRSGHIPGALWWPWSDSIDLSRGFKHREPAELLKSLAKIGVRDKKTPIVVYCRSGHRAAQAYMTLRFLGFSDVKLYDGSILEYATDKSVAFNQGLAP